MLKVTAICYLSSLLFYGMGYKKTLVIKNALTIDTYDYTIFVSLATGYFVLAILLAIIGSLFFYIKNNAEQKIIEMEDIECRLNRVGNCWITPEFMVDKQHQHAYYEQ